MSSKYSKNALKGAANASRRLKERWERKRKSMIAVTIRASAAGARKVKENGAPYNAKSYALIDPDGRHYSGDNLPEFTRSIAARFAPVSPAKAAVLLAQLRPWRKNPVNSWRGWRWNLLHKN